MLSDIEISQRATLLPITSIASRLGIPPEAIDCYGRYKAKLALEYAASLDSRPNGALVLVTAISPTPAGEGKTTTTIGLGDALNRIGKKSVVCLREPSLGPVFGMKGGSTGGEGACGFVGRGGFSRVALMRASQRSQLKRQCA